MAGRPSIYSDELAQEICEAIATNTVGLDRICNEKPHFPERSTIYKWMMTDEKFFNMYAKAKKIQAELLLDKSMSVACEDDIFDNLGKEDSLIKINRARLKIDTFKFCAVKLNPDRFADRQKTENTHKLHEDDLKNLK